MVAIVAALVMGQYALAEWLWLLAACLAVIDGVYRITQKCSPLLSFVVALFLIGLVLL
jgi:hypothetical protein